jgi:hypothetical protein
MAVVGQLRMTSVARMQGVSVLRRRAFGLRPVPTSPSRPSGFNPFALRASLASGESPAAYPRRAMLGAPEVPEPAAPDRPRQRVARYGVSLFFASLQLLAHLRQKLIGLLQVVAGIGQRQQRERVHLHDLAQLGQLVQGGLLRSRSSVLM